MHRATLQGLRLVGNKLTAKDQEAYCNKVCTSLDHHAITTVLGTGVVADDLGHPCQGITKAQGTEEPKDPTLPPRHMIMKTTKKRWKHHALLAEFGPHLYLKVLNYPIPTEIRRISGATIMALRLFTSSQNTRRIRRDSNAKFTAPPHWRSTVMVEQARKGTIGRWEELTKYFTSFKSTYKRPVSIEEVKACIQQRNVTFRSYIQRWSNIKNSAVEVSDERAIDAFTLGLRR
jgi:hypothetical protein